MSEGEEDTLSVELPAGIKSATWIPVKMGSDFFFECHIDGFGHRAKGVSRDKRRALAYALEALSRLVVQEPQTDA